MKKIITTFTLICFVTFVNAQNFKALYEKILTFDTQEQYDEADKDILKAVDYLLTHKHNEKTENYKYALKSMIKWMDGTSKYAIIIGGKLAEDLSNKSLMLNMYMAGMAKYLLTERFENNRYVDIQAQKEKNFMERDAVREIQLNGAKIVLDYIENFAKIEPSKKIKKAIKAYKKDKLYSYMFD